MKPLFSIITICLNAESSIKKTIHSVLIQEYSNYEYIVIDGASTDKTLDVLNKNKNEKMKIYSEADRGISDAFNKGIKYSKGEYLCFLNSGDYFCDEYILKNVSNDLKNLSEEIVSYSITSIMNECFPKNETEGYENWKKSMIPHQGCFIRRDVFEKVGKFNINFKVRMDYEFFSRCYVQNISYKCIPKVIVCYDSSGISSTDEYHVHKEGLAVRLIFKEQVSPEELKIMQYLIRYNGKYENNLEKELEEQKNIANKHFKIMMAMNAWIHALQDGKHIEQYFEKNCVNNIAIYGWGYLGKSIDNELKKTNISVDYIIDQNKDNFEDSNIYDWNDFWPAVDMIVVTPFYEYQNIRKKIKEKINCKVISIEELIKES